MKTSVKKLFVLAIAAVMLLFAGCGELVGNTVGIKSVTVKAGDTLYNAYGARDLTQNNLQGDSSQWGYGDKIIIEVHLPGYGYNQHLTLEHNGEVILAEQAYSAASKEVTLVKGENTFVWYVNLPTDGEKAINVKVVINHNPPEQTETEQPETEQPESLVIPGIIGNSVQSTNLTLSGYGIEDIVIELYDGPLKGEEYKETPIPPPGYKEFEIYKGSVYYKAGTNEKGEKIGDFVRGEDFVLPAGVGYGDIIAEYYYTPSLVEVPNVAGMTKEAAMETLRDLRLVPNDLYSYTNNAQEGVVYSQYNIGDRLPRGSQVTIFVSRGRDPAEIEAEISAASSLNTVQSLSSEARLRSLKLIYGDDEYIADGFEIFSGGFNPDQYEYIVNEIYVTDMENQKYIIEAIPLDSKASVSFPVNEEGTFIFSASGHKLTVTVTAEDGTQKVYTVIMGQPSA